MEDMTSLMTPLSVGLNHLAIKEKVQGTWYCTSMQQRGHSALLPLPGQRACSSLNVQLCIFASGVGFQSGSSGWCSDSL